MILGSDSGDPPRPSQRHRRDVERLGLGGDGGDEGQKGWPADIITIVDGNDVGQDTRKGKGRSTTATGSRPRRRAEAEWPDRRVWIVVGLAAVLAIGFVVVAQR